MREERVRQSHRRAWKPVLTSTIVSVGSTNADFVVPVDRLPDGAGSTIGDALLRTSGGKAANVAVLAARLGAPALLISCVGEDDLAAQALAGPRAANVDLAGVRRRPGTTGYAAITVDERGDKAIVVALGANGGWADEEAAVAEEVTDAPDGSVVVVDVEVPPVLAGAALAAARRRGFASILDPAPPVQVGDDLLGLADHLTPNEGEARELSGMRISSLDDARRAAVRLHERGVRHVHVKLTGGGCVTASPGGVLITDGPADVDVVDTTGAGDAFAGGLAWALLRGEHVDVAVRTAVAAATCAVTAIGSQESYLGLDALRAMRTRVPEPRRS